VFGNALAFKNKEIGRKARSLIGQAPRRIEFIGKAGCSWKLEYDRFTLKCFEVRTKEKAGEVIEIIGLLAERRVPVPAVVAHEDNLIFTEWICGNPLSKNEIGHGQDMRGMAEYQGNIHRLRVEGWKPAFDHWMMLRERLLRNARLRFTRGMYSEVVGICSQLDLIKDRLLRVLAPSVTNPAFTNDNVVKDGSGRLFMVDNEYLTVGIGRGFDLAYTLDTCFKGEESKAKDYLRYYGALCSADEYYRYKGFWEACNTVRKVGKRLGFYRTNPMECHKQLMIVGEQL